MPGAMKRPQKRSGEKAGGGRTWWPHELGDRAQGPCHLRGAQEVSRTGVNHQRRLTYHQAWYQGGWGVPTGAPSSLPTRNLDKLQGSAHASLPHLFPKPCPDPTAGTHPLPKLSPKPPSDHAVLARAGTCSGAPPARWPGKLPSQLQPPLQGPCYLHGEGTAQEE